MSIRTLGKVLTLFFIFIIILNYGFADPQTFYTIEGLNDGVNNVTTCNISPGTYDCVLTGHDYNIVDVVRPVPGQFESELINLIINQDTELIITYENNNNNKIKIEDFNKVTIRNSKELKITNLGVIPTFETNCEFVVEQLARLEIDFDNVWSGNDLSLALDQRHIKDTLDESLTEPFIIYGPLFDFKEKVTNNGFLIIDSPKDMNIILASRYFNFADNEDPCLYETYLIFEEVDSAIPEGVEIDGDEESYISYNTSFYEYETQERTCGVGEYGTCYKCVLKEAYANKFTSFYLEESKGVVFTDLNNNGILNIDVPKQNVDFLEITFEENDYGGFYYDLQFLENYSEFKTPIYFNNYTGNNLPTLLNNGTEDISYLSTCNNYDSGVMSNLNNFIDDYNVCKLYYMTPYANDLNITDSKVEAYLRNCENQIVIPDEEIDYFGNPNKTVFPHLFGKIQLNANQTIVPELNNNNLRYLTEQNEIAQLNRNVRPSNYFVVSSGSQELVSGLSLFKYYNINSNLTYQPQDGGDVENIGINYPFTLTK